MNEKALIAKSKFLSLILRHDPAAAGITLDKEGWTDVDGMIDGAAARGKALSRDVIAGVMALPGKQRFELSPDGKRIRAMQGHSAKEVAIAYAPETPPETLYHGTATRFLDSIRAGGLMPGNRHLVHLSPDEETAAAVGRRHGRPVVLPVAADAMHRAGHEFHLAGNGVWLVKTVPPGFLTFPDTGAASL